MEYFGTIMEETTVKIIIVEDNDIIREGFELLINSMNNYEVLETFSSCEDALKKALEAINTFRTEEGKVLEKDFVNRLSTLNGLLDKVKEMDTERLATIRERLERAVADLKADVDANRFEQELIYYLEKYDITEEKVRLANHLDYFKTTLQSKDSNGAYFGKQKVLTPQPRYEEDDKPFRDRRSPPSPLMEAPAPP